jgi:PAS domain S-box-containing protein
MIVGVGLVAAGWQITAVLGTSAQHQRMIGVASRQSALSLRAADFSDNLFFTPSAQARDMFEKTLADWLAEETALEKYLDSVCGVADPLCVKFQDLKAQHFKIERWLQTSAEWRTAAERDVISHSRDAAIDAYSEAVDRWTEDLAVRLSAATLAQQRSLFLWSLLFSVLAGGVIIAMLEPKIRRLQAERSIIDRWTADREKLATVAERTHHSVFIIDREGKIEWANEAFLRLTDRSLDQAVGSPITEMLREPAVNAETRARILSSLELGESFQFDLVYPRGSGEPYWASIDCRPIRVDGHIASYFAIESDITERKRSEDIIVQQRAMLAATSEMAGVGGWQLDFATETTTWSQTLFHIHELPVGRVPVVQDVLEYFPGAARKTVSDAIEVARAEGVSSDFEVPFVTASGKQRWMRAIITAQHIDDRRVGIIGAVQDITDVRQTAEHLKAAKNAADAASSAKGLFLANMSHEIRTPLNGVIGMTGLLLDTKLSAQQREYADIARSSGHTLLALINDILDISKIEAGELRLEIIDFDLAAVIGETLDAVALKASEKQLELLADVDPACPTVLRGDPTRLRQVLLNLMSNAVKFTARGEVTLAVRHAVKSGGGIALSFTVTDTGKGITPDAIGKLFTPFTQGDASTTRRHGGTGLGLSICRRLVQAMGGEISVQSTEGQGSTFQFGLDFAPGAAAGDAALHSLPGLRVLLVLENPVHQRIMSARLMSWRLNVMTAASATEALGCWSEMSAAGKAPDIVIMDRALPDRDGVWLGSEIRARDPLRHSRLLLLCALNPPLAAEARAWFEHVVTKPVKPDMLFALLARSGEPAHPEQQALSRSADRFKGSRVLLVDDNAVNRKVGEHLLEQLGVAVTLAANGVEALAQLRSAHFDAVLMDCQMPEMDGYEATRQIRRPRNGMMNSRVPVIALTANALSGDRDLCIAAGMNEYITKPIDPKQLAAALQSVLDRTPMPALRSGLGTH